MMLNKNAVDKLTQLQRLESMRAVKVNHLQHVSLYCYPITALCDIREGQILHAFICVEFSDGLNKHLFYEKRFVWRIFQQRHSWFEKVEMRVSLTQRWGDPKTKVGERTSLC